MLLLGPEVVDHLVELLILLEVVLELVDGFLGDLVEFVLFLFDWSSFFDLGDGFLLFWGGYILLLNVHFVLVHFLAQ
jgi:hypothetical protein